MVISTSDWFWRALFSSLSLFSHWFRRIFSRTGRVHYFCHSFFKSCFLHRFVRPSVYWCQYTSRSEYVPFLPIDLLKSTLFQHNQENNKKSGPKRFSKISVILPIFHSFSPFFSPNSGGDIAQKIPENAPDYNHQIILVYIYIYIYIYTFKYRFDLNKKEIKY